ncbi:TetR family transcriptional regulator [Arthrobacter deserti]|uniref:TetR family transcriptional regulator n=1 Tax=Arthrobacter deserti TaxID=1742687 RepID=A0ABX1JJI2_9MICC|nr:TetR family transcriptional regulator [Arthrobacter deserti]
MPPRDPEGRRKAITDAALEIIAEVGVANTSHRAVAARAGVPLGSTTYYFRTLEDLTTAALNSFSESLRAEAARWAALVDGSADIALTMAVLAEEYLSNRRRAVTEYELCLAAARDPNLRALAQAWPDGLQAPLAPRIGAANAAAVAMLIDGAMIQSLSTGRALDRGGLEQAVRHFVR